MNSTLSKSSTSDVGRQFLDHFPSRERSLISNIFLDKLRGGSRFTNEILVRVRADVERRLSSARRSRDAGRIDQFSRLLHTLTVQHADARSFARWCLNWEALSGAERERVKTNRSAEHRDRWMSGQPATDKQIAYLRRLGYQEPVESKLEASRLIDELTAGSPAR